MNQPSSHLTSCSDVEGSGIQRSAPSSPTGPYVSPYTVNPSLAASRLVSHQGFASPTEPTSSGVRDEWIFAWVPLHGVYDALTIPSGPDQKRRQDEVDTENERDLKRRRSEAAELEFARMMSWRMAQLASRQRYALPSTTTSSPSPSTVLESATAGSRFDPALSLPAATAPSRPSHSIAALDAELQLASRLALAPKAAPSLPTRSSAARGAVPVAPVAPAGTQALRVYTPSQSMPSGATRPYNRIHGAAPPRVALPVMDVTASEIFAYLPRHFQWVACWTRLAGNGWTSETLVAKCISEARSLAGDAEYSHNTVGRQISTAGRNWSGDNSWVIRSGVLPAPTTNLSTAGWTAPDYLQTQLCNIELKALATDVDIHPTGIQAGPLTRCIAYAVDHPDEALLLSDVPWLIHREGFQMPPFDGNRDQAALAQFRQSHPRT